MIYEWPEMMAMMIMIAYDDDDGDGASDETKAVGMPRGGLECEPPSGLCLPYVLQDLPATQTQTPTQTQTQTQPPQPQQQNR